VTSDPPKEPPAPPPAGAPDVKGASGKDDKPDSGPPKLSSGEKPFSIETEPWAPHQQPVLPVDPHPEDPPPVILVGEVINVTAQCHGAKPLRELRLPPLPRRDMRSSLSGEEIVCTVDVTTTGQATADCGQSSEIPSLLVREAKKIVESTPWKPAKNENEEPCEGQVTVKFPWD